MTLITESRADAAAAGGAGARRARMPRIPIRVLIFLLLFVLVVPAGLFLGYIVQRVADGREQEVSRRGELLSAEIAERLEAEFSTMATILSIFASSGWLEEEQYTLMHQRAQRALAGTERYLLVLNENLDQILNTRVRFGTPLGRTANPHAARQVLEEGGVRVSQLFEGRVAGTLVFNVLQRAVLPDGRRRVLILTRNAEALRQLFGPAHRETGWSFAVLDGAGRVGLTEIDAEQTSPTMPAICLEPILGFRTWGAAEAEQFVFRSPVAGSDWNVCVWGGSARLLERTDPLWGLFLVGTVAWFGLATIAAVALSTSLSRAITETARVGDALQAGRPVRVAPSFVTEVDHVRHALADAAAERLRKDQERQLLLRETAHRAKNQMALAVSLIGLSAQSARDVEALRQDVTERLVALGRAVDVATGPQADAAPLDRLIRVQLEPFLDHRADRLVLDGDALLVSQTAAQSLSLILHELATNAAKYGGWADEGGLVEVRWRLDGETLEIDWRETAGNGNDNDGGGGGEGTAGGPARSGFGTTLVDRLVQGSFRGTIERDFAPTGLQARIRVPLEAITAPAPGAGD